MPLSRRTILAYACAGLMAMGAILLACFPDVAAAVEYRRLVLDDGEWWRGFSGHLAHWNATHLFWDLSTFLILSLLAIRLAPGRYVLCLVASASAIPAALWYLQPSLSVYRGLSGLDSAVFVFVAILFPTLAPPYRFRTWSLLAVLALAAFSAKLLFEYFTARTLFVPDMGPHVTGVPLAHLVGGLVGALAACPLPHRQSATQPA